MKTIWLNDIHLEFLEERAVRRFLTKLDDNNVEAILLAGDIGTADSVALFLRQMQDHLGIPIYFVLGNHDYYDGSITGVRSAIRSLARECPYLYWLSDCGAVSLTPKTSLVGHDGWGDGRLGDYERSDVQLNDFRMIVELSGLGRQQLHQRLMQFGDEAAEHLRSVLPKALASSEHVVVMMHVPPFLEAAWHNGQHSGPDWLPFFSCKAAGDVLVNTMQEFPEKKMTVLCGHTHGSGQSQILPNLVTFTGAAQYGRPAIQRVFDWE